MSQLKYLSLAIFILPLLISMKSWSTELSTNETGTEQKWQSLDEKIVTISTGLQKESFSIEINDLNKLGPQLKYVPNLGEKLHLGVDYKLASFSLGIPLNKNPQPTELFGETQSLDFQIKYYGSHWSTDLFYQDYKGFYIENAESAGLSTLSKVKNDLFARNIGISVYYNLNPLSYSAGANFNQSQLQLESGGAWFIYSSINHNHLGDPISIIPIEASQYQAARFVKNINSHVLSVGGSGAYNFIYDHFFLGGMLTAGLTYQNTKIENSISESISGQTNGSRFNIKLSTGYNDENKFISFILTNDGQNFSIINSQYILDSSFFQLTYGYRFK